MPVAAKLLRAKLEDEAACWPWPGKRNPKGYGKLTHGRKELYAHRAAAESAGLDIDGRVVMHTCDNPRCVNPRHLVVGSQADNIADCKSKGRLFHQKKTHCVNGHPLVEGNLYKNRYRVCRLCAIAAAKRWRANDRREVSNADARFTS